MPHSQKQQQRLPDAVPRERNEGISLDLTWIRRFSVSTEKLEADAARAARVEVPGGELKPKELIRVLSSMDLTTLSGDDTLAGVRRLCRTARSPLSGALKKQLGKDLGAARVAAVCVFPAFVPAVLEALEGSGIPVATVAAGFPHGLSTLAQRVDEVAGAAEMGAQEIDVVIRREWVLSGAWGDLYEEVQAFRNAAGDARLKVILSTGELETLSQVGRAALTALAAGADFVKTSTGKERVNATLPAGMAMLAALKRYRNRTGHLAGLKPAGGIRTARDGYQWLRAMEKTFGPEATGPAHFRIGASSLLADVVETLSS